MRHSTATLAICSSVCRHLLVGSWNSGMCYSVTLTILKSVHTYIDMGGWNSVDVLLHQVCGDPYSRWQTPVAYVLE